VNSRLRRAMRVARVVGMATACAALLLASSCTRLVVLRPWGPPPHARARGLHKKLVYHYYPDLEIYWIVASKQYAVLRSGAWVVVDVRPKVIAASHSFVVIETDAPKPWLKHAYYKKKYPPGWSKAKGKK